MGMEQNTFTISPNQNRRIGRARRAKETVVKSIPEILRTSLRARHGINNAELIVDPEPAAQHAVTSTSSRPEIRLSSADTLTAAARLSDRPFSSRRTVPTLQTVNNIRNVTILNMASPLRPAGGFLDGANGQEEFLCHRTTLYPSLWDSFYPLPETGAIYTPDVMAFQDTTPEAMELPKRSRYFVDVITGGMFRFPDVRRGRSGDSLDGACSCGMSYCDRDRELVTRKMKTVLRIAQSKGAQKLILGAWGCGSYGNPVKDVAKLWRKVIAGSPRQRRPNAEQWEGINEIVFAIPDPVMMREFRQAFSDILAPEAPSPPSDDAEASVEQQSVSRETEIAELVVKVQETEMQIEQMSNPRTRARLRDALDGLNRQLAQGRAAKALKGKDSAGDETPEGDEQIDDFVVTGIPGSDEEDENVYAFDDVASDSSECPVSVNYEFRPPPPGLDPPTSHDEDDEPVDDSFFNVRRPSLRFDAKTGWFSGSIDEFHGFLRGNGQRSREVSHSSPVLRPDSSGQMVIDELVLDQYLGRYEGTNVHAA